MTISKIHKFIRNKNIKPLGLREHSKAGEKYVDVKFRYPGKGVWEGSVPYHYRRVGLFADSPDEIAKLIVEAYEALKPKNAAAWVKTERKSWKANHSGKTVTKAFFDKLLNLRWNSIESDFPNNPNWARRIQDIKEFGYTLATDTKRYDKRLKKNVTHVILLPLPKGPQTGYETISPKLKQRIIKVLGSYDAYEGKKRPAYLLIPDHKFPEISWDEKTRRENPDDMSDKEIRQKFQLLDNQRNLEKREACRKIIRTGKRGALFGIKYYYEGDENWPKGVPKVGKGAEKGWIGSPWYDIEAWRQSLNKFIGENQKKKRVRRKK